MCDFLFGVRPELILWVHTTLVEASPTVFQRFVCTLSTAVQGRYHREMALVARLFCAPRRRHPALTC